MYHTGHTFFVSYTSRKIYNDMSYTLQIQGQLIAPNGERALQTMLDKYVPYEYIIEWLRMREGRTGPNNRFLVIKSGTGSGKSITIPSEIYINLVRARSSDGGPGVICTQPRVITAIDNVKKIISIPKYASAMKLGETIGWSTHKQKMRAQRSGLLSATLGVLAAQLLSYSDIEIMQHYKYIIIDEAHERPVTADIVMSMLKRLLYRNAGNVNCPYVILMSATIEPFAYTHFFLSNSRAQNQVQVQDRDSDDNIIICGSSPPFQRTIIWPSADIRDMREEIVTIISRIQDEHSASRESWDPDATTLAGSAMRERDDILIFVPGNELARAIMIALREYNEKNASASASAHDNKRRALLLVLLNRAVVTSGAPEYRQLDVPLREINKLADTRAERRVIISTSIAETGVTFATVRYVIDCGLSREPEYNPHDRISALISRPAQKSRVEQRWGRVGRIFEGAVYPLYTREIYDQLQTQQMPEVITAGLGAVILDIIFDQQRTKALANDPEPYFRVGDIDMITRPSIDVLTDALDHARNLGFIAHNCPKFAIDAHEFINAPNSMAPNGMLGITRMGRIALELSSAIIGIAPEAIRIILAGLAWGIRTREMASIAAMQLVITNDMPTSRALAQSISASYDILLGSTSTSTSTSMSTGTSTIHKILGDTFCDALVLCEVIDRSMRAREGARASIDQLGALSIGYDVAASIIDARDSIIATLIEFGLDVSRGDSLIDDVLTNRTSVSLARLDPLSASDIVIRYKRCIYEGCRDAVITMGSDSMYLTPTGLPVDYEFGKKMSSTGIDGIPRAVACLNLIGAQTRRDPRLYAVMPGAFFTILDGYVGHDGAFSM